jgi:hypothetical protein
MKQWQAGLFIAGSILSILIIAACNSAPQKTEEDEFKKRMEQKWSGRIAESFEKSSQSGEFTGGVHDKHAKWGEEKRGKQGCAVCHIGGNVKHIPESPKHCYECHDQKSKVPFKGFDLKE